MNVLSIAGSDPSSGAGIQGDLKAFSVVGAHGLCVITALTSQNTSKFFDVSPVEPSTVRAQLRAIFSDFDVAAIKIGMVYNSHIIKTIHSELKHIAIPIILDPVFESTTKGNLLRDDAFSDFKKFLIPLAYVITPNLPEAERITGMRIRTLADMKKAALKISLMGPKNVIIKGGHVQNRQVTDILLEDKKFHVFSQKRINRHTHGGGCLFSAVLCVSIGRKTPLVEAVRSAQQASIDSIKNSKRIGKGLSIVQRTRDTLAIELSIAINKFANIESIYNYIPECQTNFVYSKPRPRSINDILGIEGRMVKTGMSVTIAGNLKYGGSKHVASAVLEITKKFPSVRAALNIKYNDITIEKTKAKKFRVSYYDRRFESDKNKKKEGTTISWGIKDSIKDMKIPPDVIYHKGDMGKEPMILIFGKTPTDVIAKLVKIVT